MSDETTAIAGTRKAVKELVDGTLRVQIDIEPRDKATFHRLFPEIDTPIAIAPMNLSPGSQLSQPQETSKYGDEARQLRQSSFFRRPDVWRAVGTDAEFLVWLRTQECAARSSECSGQVVPAHVRRVENGAGTGIKPPYSAIPLCDGHHQMQTNHGESAVHGREWFDKMRIEYLVKWCWITLKRDLGYDSWADVPPPTLLAWAEGHDVADFNGSLTMPRCYYDTQNT